MATLKSYVEGVPIEQEVWDQVARLSRLPFVERVALMPDAHVGIGSTVGSVIGTVGAIIPACVGVDIGCTDANTEYLSPSGWRKISEYSGGPIMQYRPHDGVGEFVSPERYVARPSSGFLHFKTKYGIDQMVSPDHKMLVWRISGRRRSRTLETVPASAVMAEHERLKLGAKVEFATTFRPKLDGAIAISDDCLRVQVAVMADGYIDKSRRAVLRLKKQRKIARLRMLLTAAEIEFSEKESYGIYTFRFTPPFVCKSYSGFWGASLAQLHVISSECLRWDGNEKDSVFFTRDRASADFIQYAFSATGRRGTMRSDVCRSDGKADYRVYANSNTMVGLSGSPKSKVSEAPSVDGFEYCFTVPSGFWVMRRGGNVVVTGNCGMSAQQTTLTANDLPDSLSDLRSEIERAVPAGGPGGVGSWKEPGRYGPPASVMRSWASMADRYASLVAKYPKLESGMTVDQLGTLGTGNHFIEVCLDRENRVWVMLHSGSRGLGNRIGSMFISMAKNEMKSSGISLEDRDLAFLSAGTWMFEDYIEAVGFAQGFARANRTLMMHRVLDVLRSRIRPFELGSMAISCHHNYVEEETHFGKSMLVTRKGAVRAGSGDLGIIPGSMGAKSYITRGLGNPESLMSSSHGAGRVMSRTRARKEISLDQHLAALPGVECRRDEGLIDESPACYKNIDAVMAAQSDLVEIVEELRQVIVVKG